MQHHFLRPAPDAVHFLKPAEPVIGFKPLCHTLIFLPSDPQACPSSHYILHQFPQDASIRFPTKSYTNKCPCGFLLENAFSSVHTSRSDIPLYPKVSGLESDSRRFTLLKDNPSGNCRKWHIPHSFYISINLSDKSVVNFNIPYFLTILVFPPLMDCDFLNQFIQKRGGKLVNGTVFLD